MVAKKTFTTEENDQIVALYRAGKWATEIAQHFATCSYIIVRTLRENGLVVTKRIESKTLTDEQRAIVKDMYPSHSLDFISRHLGLGREVITKFLRAEHIQIQGRGKQPNAHGYTVDGEKVCSKCRLPKSVNAFSRHANTTDGLQPSCRACQSVGHRDYLLQRKFGITEAEYDEMLESQSGVCAICGQPETRIKFGKPTMLAVDHNHRTGAVRQLICFRCNVVIGRVEESPALCDKIKAYLIQHNGLLEAEATVDT